MKDRFPEEIKNSYKKDFLANICIRYYENIKESQDYKLEYRLYSEFSNWKDALSEGLFVDPVFLYSVEQVSDTLEEDIKRKWKITTPISPYLNIKREDLTKPTIVLTGSLAKVLVAFGVLQHPRPTALICNLRRIYHILFPSAKAKKIHGKKKTLLGTKAQQKFLIHSLMKSGCKGRNVARIFNIGKDAVRDWSKEAESWSVQKKEDVRLSLFGGRKRKNKDVHDLYHKSRRPPSGTDAVEDDIRGRVDTNLRQQ